VFEFDVHASQLVTSGIAWNDRLEGSARNKFPGNVQVVIVAFLTFLLWTSSGIH
jgi:hypothetical protein